MNQITLKQKTNWYLRALIPLILVVIHLFLLFITEQATLTFPFDIDPFLLRIVSYVIYFSIILIAYFILLPLMNITDPIGKDYDKATMAIFIASTPSSIVMFIYAIYFLPYPGLEHILMAFPSGFGFYLINKWVPMNERISLH